MGRRGQVGWEEKWASALRAEVTNSWDWAGAHGLGWEVWAWGSGRRSQAQTWGVQSGGREEELRAS